VHIFAEMVSPLTPGIDKKMGESAEMSTPLCLSGIWNFEKYHISLSPVVQAGFIYTP